MAAIIGHDGPEVAALGGLRPGSRTGARDSSVARQAIAQQSARGDEDANGTAQMSAHMVDDGHQVEAGAPRPVAERAAVEMEPLPLEDPGLAVERKEVAELR